MTEHCEETLNRLYEYIDRELDENSAAFVRAHVDDCPPCGGAYSFEERLLVVIRTGLREEIPEVVVERIRAAIRAEIV